MTGVKLKQYLLKSGIFSNDYVYMIEILNGFTYNIPTYYKCRVDYNNINISLYRKKYNDDLLIGFTKNNNETSSHKLSELTLSTLVKELDKIFVSIPDIRHLKIVQRYMEWRLECLIEHRNDIIESILLTNKTI